MSTPLVLGKRKENPAKDTGCTERYLKRPRVLHKWEQKSFEHRLREMWPQAWCALNSWWRSGLLTVTDSVEWLWGEFKASPTQEVPVHVQFWVERLGRGGARSWFAFRVLSQLLGRSYMLSGTSVHMQRAVMAAWRGCVMEIPPESLGLVGAEIMRWFIPAQARSVAEMEQDTLSTTVFHVVRGDVLRAGLGGMAWGGSPQLASQCVLRFLRTPLAQMAVRAYWEKRNHVPLCWRPLAGDPHFRRALVCTSGTYMSVVVSVGTFLFDHSGTWMAGWWRGVLTELSRRLTVRELLAVEGGVPHTHLLHEAELHRSWVVVLATSIRRWRSDRWLRGYYASGPRWAPALGLVASDWASETVVFSGL